MPVIPTPPEREMSNWLYPEKGWYFHAILNLPQYMFTPDPDDTEGRTSMMWECVRGTDIWFRKQFPSSPNEFRVSINELLTSPGDNPPLDPAFDTPLRLPDMAQRRIAGETAGTVLEWLLRAKVSHPDFANLSAICGAVQQYQHEALGYAERTRHQVFKNWKEFKAVSHFWLAESIMSESPWLYFCFADKYRCHGQQAGIFSHDETWYFESIPSKLQSDVRLPCDDGLLPEQRYYFNTGKHSGNRPESKGAQRKSSGGGKRGGRPKIERASGIGARVNAKNWRGVSMILTDAGAITIVGPGGKKADHTLLELGLAEATGRLFKFLAHGTGKYSAFDEAEYGSNSGLLKRHVARLNEALRGAFGLPDNPITCTDGNLSAAFRVNAELVLPSPEDEDEDTIRAMFSDVRPQ